MPAPGYQREELDSGASALKCEVVIDGHWMHDRFEFVKTVGPLAEDLEEEVRLRRRIGGDNGNDLPRTWLSRSLVLP